MARNRKSQSAAIRFGPALKAALLCVLIGGAGVGYVWQKDQIFRLSLQYKARESLLQHLVDQNADLRKKLAALRAPKYLQDWAPKLGMAPTQVSQFWVLPEPPLEMPRPAGAPQYAVQTEPQAMR